MRALRCVVGVQTALTALLVADLLLLGDPVVTTLLLALSLVAYPVLLVLALEVGGSLPSARARRANRWALIPFLGGLIMMSSIGQSSGALLATGPATRPVSPRR